MSLKILEAGDGQTHVALSGRLDAAAVRELEAQFAEQVVGRRKPVLLDLHEVTFLSSMAMRMLLTAAKELGKGGMRIVILRPRRMEELGLKAAGLDSLMPIEHDVERGKQLLA